MKKASSEEINPRSSNNVISPEEEKNHEEMNALKLQIGNYFTSSTIKNLFGCQDNEEVYDCLSCRIDIFQDIISNKIKYHYGKSPINVTKKVRYLHHKQLRQLRGLCS